MTDEETATVAEPCTWRAAFTEALTLGSDALALLHLLDETDGKAGVPVPIDALAERLDVQPSTVKTLLTRLEAAGWVTREPEKHNGRAVLVPYTAVEVQ